ncbi:MAG TPA: adenosine deaminase [Candidatus Xenobia bacterium]|jgi:adenosine deaminase
MNSLSSALSARPRPRLQERPDTWLAGKDRVPVTPEDHELKAYTQAMPKVDLHRHMEGAVTAEMMLKIAKRFDIQLPTQDLKQLRGLMQVNDKDKTLLDFIKKFDTIGKVFSSADAVKAIAYQTVRDAADDNVKYLELRFSPLYIAQQYGVKPADVMDAVAKGAAEASKKGDIKTNLIAIVEREMPVQKAWEVEKLAEGWKDKGVVALDLANDEKNYPPGPFAAVFQAAHKAGLHVTVHAGEAGPAANVKTSIEQLDAERIGHGIQTAADPAVEKVMLDRHVTPEMCPTSNDETHAAEGLPQYPMRRFYDEGLRPTVNTDDPAVCGVTLSGECYKVVHELGMSIPELQQMEYNGIDAAFISDADKAQLHQQFEQSYAQLNPTQDPQLQAWLTPRR